MDAELVAYYRRRAREYEAIYAKPERQADLALLRERIPALLAGRRILEVACGTGYWTECLAAHAREIVAVDLAEEAMAIARAKAYPPERVRFEPADAYALPVALGAFGGAFAGFWWSHVPRGRIGEFLGSLHARLEPGSTVVLLDNRYVEGSSTPIAGFDVDGNTFQVRRMTDGGTVRVMKNFPSEDELRRDLAPRATAIEYVALEYYWLVSYRTA